MFAILPQNQEFDFAEYFSDENNAYEEAIDWSIYLGGDVINIYEKENETYNLIAKVYA